ncbi:ATP-dependent helicase [Planctomonas psychrotolerans]|uniref:ATP-dependent helicase n=1 Tax=Planctomonas psychrotolerans TaxID=2528712 RepID=UPI00123A200F
MDLAARLGQPSPTPQQVAVIEAPLTPALVVAGAGSGKTETMANRVLWLLANGLVREEEVLGLTFTRKAAGELTQRIGARIGQLRSAGLLPSADGFEQPTVSTYNSFANAIFRDNALLVGREPESVLLSDSAAWLLARSIVRSSGDERLVPLARSLGSVTDAVLELSREIGENIVDSSRVVRLVEQFSYLTDLPYTDGAPKNAPYASVTKAVDALGALPVIVELADRYAAEKKRRGLVEYSDQVALALAVCERSPGVPAEYRSRYRVVLLDEYQDTSVVQTRLLSTLFAGHGVMAVGDPHQSIYGWRGASAANLARFERDFGGGEPIADFALSTSWRNATTVLAAANAVVAPLTAASSVRVEPLSARPGAPVGSVVARYAETVEEEATGIADWLADGLDTRRPDGERRSAAILFRTRSAMGLFAEALAERGVPHHVLGIGGLLLAPEIVDLVSTLRVMSDPSAGSPLVRLLGGARWAIGVADLQHLSRVAGWLHARDWAQQRLADDITDRMRESVAAEDGRSIVDALDFVTEAPEGHGQLAGFSAPGLARLRAAGRQLAFFRSRAGLPLPDLVRLVEQELLLDIEVSANDTAALGLANLYAFHDELDGFLASDDLATLGSFLGWLDRAEREDTMGPRSENAEPGSVQLLTIHGAKGLEWDLVVVPRLVADELPNKPREGTGWVRFGKLPYEFRGDAAELPHLAWRGLATQKEFDTNLAAYAVALAERHRAEERRLAYVALTRAREHLLLTGSFWSSTTKPRFASVFLLELLAADLVNDDVPLDSAHETNPRAGAELTVSWPLDPLGARRARVERAAAAVQAAATTEKPDAGRWQRDLDLLLAERDRAMERAGTVELPTRIPASRFKDFVTDPAKVASSLRRPMPERPFRQTRLGTLFHDWVESRFGPAGSGDLIDALPVEADIDPLENPLDRAELERLQRTFERSEWAGLQPVAVEVEIHVRIADQIVICKIDAVYEIDGRYRVVDWKTGKAPTTAADLELRQLQLALYRLAFARWKGIDPDLIDAEFYYVSEDRVIRPDRIYSESDLRSLWSESLEG